MFLRHFNEILWKLQENFGEISEKIKIRAVLEKFRKKIMKNEKNFENIVKNDFFFFGKM